MEIAKLKYLDKVYEIKHDKALGHYNWQDGNWACDCNRSLEIGRQYPETQKLFKVDPNCEVYNYGDGSDDEYSLGCGGQIELLELTENE